MAHLSLERKKNVSSFRKIAIGTWRTAYDPSVYGTIDIRMDEALRYMAQFRERTGQRLTVTHLIARAVGELLKETPDANALLRGNKIYLRKQVGVFFQVVMTDEGTGKVDLSGLTLYDVEKKTLVEIVKEFEEKVEKVRTRKDPALEKTRKNMLGMPQFLIHWVLRLIAYLTYDLNLDLSWAGLPRDPFGSIMVTNIGSLGLDVAYVPLVPYSRVPILLALGAVKEVPVVDDGKIVPGKIMKVNATFDHRFIDGFHASVMSRLLRQWLENPFEHFDKLPEKSIPELPAPSSL